MDMTQTKAIADAIVYAKRFMDGRRTLRVVAKMLYDELDKSGFDILSRLPSGEYSFARKIEFACALNRLRTLKMSLRGARTFFEEKGSCTSKNL
jgi:hypothetical protein